MRHTHVRQAGFTIVEVITAMGIFIIASVAVVSIATSLQQAQRNNETLALANQSVRSIAEKLRANNESSFISCEPGYNVIDLTSSVTDTTSAFKDPHVYATITCKNQVYGIKQIDIDMYYSIGSVSKFTSSTINIGNQGLYQ